MSDAVLVGSLALMGVASLPHCALMCGAPCAAITGGRARAQAGFQFARLISYALLGAVAATALGLLREAAAANALLRPLWTLLQAGLFAFGLFLLIAGRWPAWLGQWGGKPASTPVHWQRATGAGLLWGGWPCGLLQGALLLAALANTALGAASAMAAFALASSPGLLLAPALLRKLLASRQGQTWAPRLAGAMLLGSSAWSLGHGLWLRIAELCT